MLTQAITPNPDIPCTPGWCLMYVRQTFDLPAHYTTATEAWENSTSQHQDYNFPAGCWIAVWFSIEAIPAGHVALMAPDGSVYSSSDNSSTPHHHPSINDLMAYYAYYNLPLGYLGWTEDVAGTPVVTDDGSLSYASGSTPTQEETEVTQEQIDAIVYRVNVFAQQNANDVAAVVINEVRAHAKFNGDRVLDALKEIPQIDNTIIDTLKAKLAEGADESIAQIKERLSGLSVTLTAEGTK